MVILAIGVNYCIRCLLTSVDYTYAREHGLEFNEATGLFKRAPIDAADEEGGSGSLNGGANSAASAAAAGKGKGKDDYARVQDDDADAEERDRPASPSRNGGGGSKAGRRSPSSVALASAAAAAASNGNSGRTQATQIHVTSVSGGVAQDSLSGTEAEAADPCTSPPVYSFREIGEFAYGRWGRLAVDVNLVASQLGFCIAYMSFISENMHEVVGGVGRVQWIGLLFLAWSASTQIRSMKHIGVTSGLGNLVYFVSLATIFYDGFRHACCVSAAEADWVRPQGLALVFGTGCFALEGIGLVLPVKRAMKEQHKFGHILNLAIVSHQRRRDANRNSTRSTAPGRCACGAWHGGRTLTALFVPYCVTTRAGDRCELLRSVRCARLLVLRFRRAFRDHVKPGRGRAVGLRARVPEHQPVLHVPHPAVPRVRDTRRTVGQPRLLPFLVVEGEWLGSARRRQEEVPELRRRGAARRRCGFLRCSFLCAA